MRFHFDSFGEGMNTGCNVVHIAYVLSIVMPEIVLFPLKNRKLNAAKLLPVASYLKTETTYQNRTGICLRGMIILSFIANSCNK
jgi:hypothetical protein